MSAFFGNPNFSLDSSIGSPSFGPTGMPSLAGAMDYTKLFKDHPMFNYEFQTETGDSSGAPPETVPTQAKTEDPGGLMNRTEMGELMGGIKDIIAGAPARNREQMQDFLAFEKERLRMGKPYALMEKIPDQIQKGFEATNRNLALQTALVNAGSTDIAAIMGGTKIPQAAIPGAGSYQQRVSYFGG